MRRSRTRSLPSVSPRCPPARPPAKPGSPKIGVRDPECRRQRGASEPSGPPIPSPPPPPPPPRTYARGRKAPGSRAASTSRPLKVPAALARGDDVARERRAPVTSEANGGDGGSLAGGGSAEKALSGSASADEASSGGGGGGREPEADPEVDDGVVLRRLREAREDLRISDFWSSALETINTCLMKHLEQLDAPAGTLSEAIGSLHLDSSPDDSGAAPGCLPGEALVPGACGWKCVGWKCVCYGIGSFASCVIARNQLAFLLLFLERCQIPRSHCWVYDPLFSQLEIAVLTTLGVAVLGENEEGKRSVCGEPTIFYMPHCGTALYNNLLWSNWSADALSKVVIIGNSFRGLEERLLTRILQKNYAYVAQILGGLEEQKFPQTAQYSDVFNDTSVHWFPVQKLKQLPADTWASREEPDYRDCEDLEIIRSQAGASATSRSGP